jgi:hydrogenase maturation factor
VALHDITEGGVATAIHELADANNLGLNINGEAFLF